LQERRCNLRIVDGMISPSSGAVHLLSVSMQGICQVSLTCTISILSSTIRCLRSHLESAIAPLPPRGLFSIPPSIAAVQIREPLIPPLCSSSPPTNKIRLLPTPPAVDDRTKSMSGLQHNVNNSQHNSKCNHSHSHQHLHCAHHCDYDPVSQLTVSCVHVHSHTAIAPQHPTTNRHSTLACQLVSQHRYWDGVKADDMLCNVIQQMYIPSAAYYQPDSHPSPPPVPCPPAHSFICLQTNKLYGTCCDVNAEICGK
jgi:hypothetical protein